MSKEKRKNKRSGHKQSNSVILFGKHPCFAALGNPMRKIKAVYATKNTAEELKEYKNIPIPKIIDAKAFESMLPQGATHQGIAVEVAPLPEKTLEDIMPKSPIIILDQITDPHNIGAILRSAAAFGAEGIVIQKDNSPGETGVIAKSASGALEVVPIIKATNLKREIDLLKKNGYWCVGLDGKADKTLKEIDLSGKVAFIFGAEGKGLRRLTVENCDYITKLPISDKVESLNVSNAVAITLYHLNEYA